MAKAFTVASWNVEHFKNNPARIDLVIEFLQLQKPDVFGLLEVESGKVYDTIVTKMPDYQFHITEGRQTQEILVGAKRTMTTFFTQKTEYKSGNTYLRPGALLTVRMDDVDYPILFLHTKSSPAPIGLGLRDDMFQRAYKFKRFLDKVSKNAGKGPANFIFLGDLNTMGMEYPYDRDISVEFELKRLDGRAARSDMFRLKKTHPFTWWNGPGSYPKSNLDHAVASKHMKFKKFGAAEIDVRGWVEEQTEADQVKWINTFSDHAMVFFQIEKP